MKAAYPQSGRAVVCPRRHVVPPPDVDDKPKCSIAHGDALPRYGSLAFLRPQGHGARAADAYSKEPRRRARPETARAVIAGGGLEAVRLRGRCRTRAKREAQQRWTFRQEPPQRSLVRCDHSAVILLNSSTPE